MKYKAIIFDLDGTIADTIPLTIHSLRQVIEEYTDKDASDEEILKEFGPIDTEIARKVAGENGGEEAIEKYIQYFSDNFSRFVKPIDGIQQLLEFIKSRGGKVALFTGRSLRATEIVLEKLDVKRYFDEIIPGDYTTNPKPDPEGILMALDKLEANPSEGVYVGDFDVDILASKAAGTTSVLALWSSTGSEKLIEMKPDKYFTSTKEFMEWLGTESLKCS